MDLGGKTDQSVTFPVKDEYRSWKINIEKLT